MKIQDLPIEGFPTEEEEEFINYLLLGIDTYISRKPTDRRTLIAALSKISQIVFCEHTPLSIKQQCEEVDKFCNHLKKHALRNAKRS